MVSQKSSLGSEALNVTAVEPAESVSSVVYSSVPEWERSIETLVLSHKQISKMESMEAFINLRKLQLIDNCILKIEGLNRCKLLEELSLEKNKIAHIENISHLRYLKKLDLGCNRIRRIDGLS